MIHYVGALALSLLLLIAIACAQPEPPASSSIAPPPPQPPSTWTVQLWTSGGVAGVGKGGVTVRSDGTVQPGSDCKPSLTDVERVQIETALATVNPEGWKESYHLPEPSGLTDQFHYTLHLQVGNKKYNTGWQTDSSGLLPEDLRKLVDAVWPAREQALKRCD